MHTHKFIFTYEGYAVCEELSCSYRFSLSEIKEILANIANQPATQQNTQDDELATLRAQLAEAKDIVIVLAWLDEILQPDESKEFVSVNILTSTIKKAHAWHSKVNSA